ncbi:MULTISPECIES: ATP-binding cassette domain-containing protein [Arthrobacter]|jgi:ABC-type glutathione transport system ATPase component|uniref:ABC-type glutathione transport system ATPase component n=1 Tax=Arthrobacter bambusae TaxID=1338426 RepID=A0AAW8DFH2_9MICC|nr:ATP-binding cassette domain-containing protein [Arthrobacter bambusae]MDP9903423.1 ABC-type glutathione transport system ATPase component [Arthrobacter bambusae]MDQ0128583.1 ABC-type glutathione transport system ATPase component [Arthrobacter bambusae]MDQ0179924.1 ABC-type glutathione transport system ATPase component [Arthrobacter bambusae]MDQ0238085.1 ABC-type glutathione transport system ATPase component [Arthrobacter bambusae]
MSNAATAPLLRVANLNKSYGRGVGSRNRTQILRDVSFELRRGETLGLVGESGSGKSTTAACVMGLTAVDSGLIEFDGVDLTSLSKPEMRRMRKRIQMVFQDPNGSLDPRFTVADLVEEPLVIHGVSDSAERSRRVEEVLDRVGITLKQAQRYPFAFSGGQRQRIAIARALVLNPDLVVLDEPVSALDVSIQAQVLNLLSDLQDELGLTYLFIVHDLAVARLMSHHIAVMNSGQIVEAGTSEDVFDNTTHPYTRALLDAVPGARRRAKALAAAGTAVAVEGK